MHISKWYVLIPILLSGCLDIAPDEDWDNDDTRIWIKYASSLDIPENSFTERDSIDSLTYLSYEEKFEEVIRNQIIGSRYFSETTTYSPDAELWKVISSEHISGIWFRTNRGFKFIQTPGNQYPMSIEMDSLDNLIIITEVQK